MSEEEFGVMEDRRRMQQQILRDKLAQADSRSTPDPAMTVKMTTNTGFALGTFDMSESLAIVEDLLDYFGEDELTDLDVDGEGKKNVPPPPLLSRLTGLPETLRGYRKPGTFPHVVSVHQSKTGPRTI